MHSICFKRSSLQTDFQDLVPFPKTDELVDDMIANRSVIGQI